MAEYPEEFYDMPNEDELIEGYAPRESDPDYVHPGPPSPPPPPTYPPRSPPMIGPKKSRLHHLRSRIYSGVGFDKKREMLAIDSADIIKKPRRFTYEERRKRLPPRRRERPMAVEFASPKYIEYPVEDEEDEDFDSMPVPDPAPMETADVEEEEEEFEEGGNPWGTRGIKREGREDDDYEEYAGPTKRSRHRTG